tara:strand:+ start:3749 stop:3871 length:123 start_codon:yes stop_codon:yes gene_type:complete
MKNKQTLQHYIAYFVAFVLMTAVFLLPFAGTALIKYLFNL